MKIIFFSSPQGNQRALAQKIARHLPLAGIVTVTPRHSWTKKPSLPKRLKSLAKRAAAFPVGLPLRRAWFAMLTHYDAAFPAFPEEPLEVSDINAPEVIALVEREAPDLVVVSGTNLLKPRLIDAIHRTGKVVNLHTGISPYIKGGPNCTNWCLTLRRFDLIGNTVMWLDAGIDSGAIIATERTPLTGRESLTELHIAVMEHAHALYVRCIRLFAEGRTLPSVRQDELGQGRLFLTRHWTAAPMAKAVANFGLHYSKEAALPPKEQITLVDPTQPLALSLSKGGLQGTNPGFDKLSPSGEGER
jgi:methionyl-tRNA formyltransferase